MPVVGVVEADEGVAEEGSELAAGGFELLMGAGGFDDFGEVGLDLQLGVVGGVDSRGPVDLFAGGEDWPGHFTTHEALPAPKARRLVDWRICPAATCR